MFEEVSPTKKNKIKEPQGMLKSSTPPKNQNPKKSKKQTIVEEVSPTEKPKLQEIWETQEIFEEVSPTEKKQQNQRTPRHLRNPKGF